MNTAWTGRLMMLAGVVVFFLGGINWPPRPHGLTSLALILCLLGWGATLDAAYGLQRLEAKRRKLFGDDDQEPLD